MKSIKASLLATLALSSFGMTLLPAQSASAATDRTAHVKVVNKTGSTMKNVKVVHNATGDPQSIQLGNIYDTSNQERSNVVRYRTGFLTARNKWNVYWTNDQGQACSFSRGSKVHVLRKKDEDSTVTITLFNKKQVVQTSGGGPKNAAISSASGLSGVSFSCE